MAWVKEASAATGASSTSVTVTVPTGGFPAGHLLVMGVVLSVSGVQNPAIGVSDSAGNTWVKDQSYEPITGQTTYVYQYRSILTNTLNAGATITVLATGNNTPSRYAVSVQEFDDTITNLDTGSKNDNGGSSTSSVSTSSFTTTNANTLIVATLGLVSAARTLTPNVNYTAGTKVTSTGGSSDRAVQMVWRTVTATGTYNPSGSLSAGSVFGMLGQAYIYTTGGGGGGGRTGYAKVWNGTTWVSHPAKVWNGTAWVAHEMKGYNGTTWVVGK